MKNIFYILVMVFLCIFIVIYKNEISNISISMFSNKDDSNYIYALALFVGGLFILVTYKSYFQSKKQKISKDEFSSEDNDSALKEEDLEYINEEIIFSSKSYQDIYDFIKKILPSMLQKS